MLENNLSCIYVREDNDFIVQQWPNERVVITNTDRRNVMTECFLCNTPHKIRNLSKYIVDMGPYTTEGNICKTCASTDKAVMELNEDGTVK